MTARLDTPRSERALVIVPTYNERDSIAEVVRRTFAAGGDALEMLVIDDASPDGTARLVHELIQGSHELHLIERNAKRGLGTAYLMGFRWALERGFRAVVEMDADLSHDPADIPRLLGELDRADLVIGSRYVVGGRIENWGAFRRWLSRAGNVYARALLGFDVLDSTSGFRAYSADVLRRIHLDSIRSEGYAFQIEMTRRVALARRPIVEIPITFVERAAGRSKMSRRIVLEALAHVTAWGIRDRLGARR